MSSVVDVLVADPEICRHRLARELAPVITARTTVSSAGFPYVEQRAYERLRDWVPHLFALGGTVLDLTDRLVTAAARAPGADPESIERAARVVRQVVLTAAITAPPDLWLLRHVLSSLARLGLAERFDRREVIHPDCCPPLKADELAIDLGFLLSRGYLVRSADGYRRAERPAAYAAFRAAPMPPDRPADLTSPWLDLFAGGAPGDATTQLLEEVSGPVPLPADRAGLQWFALPEEVEIGYRLLPVVLALKAAGRIEEILAEEHVAPELLAPRRRDLGARVVGLLACAGVVDDGGRVTTLGRRVLERGPGPFGIIEAYHPYMERLDDILTGGRGSIHVARGANVAASQEANRKTFRRANEALDELCATTGFSYAVFIEHAIGRGEATRQRYARSGDETIRYFGADLEDAAIDAAEEEQRAGRLPAGMVFVRNADIGEPAVLIAALERHGADQEGAVMLVGNGFHEVRDRSDEKMVEVFRGYERAGIVLLFTEESALSVDDLLATAWNTFHSGFKYVHERSGQGLRPAGPTPPSRLGGPLPASWKECAARAGYVRVESLCSRSRTVHPFTPSNGHNPAISENHVCLPARIAHRLGLAAEP